jgi:4-hydroxy-2-oxoglutarate aldolase
MNISGILPPLTTPFTDGVFDPAKLEGNMEAYERLSLGGYVILGSNGEAALLLEEEKTEVWKAARRLIPAGKTMVAGTGVESTAGTIRLTKAAADCGADVALVITPFFFKKAMTGDTLAAHYSEVAETSPIPILLYNNPKVTGVVIPAETVGTLSRHEKIVGMKDSSGDLEKLREIKSIVPADFQLLCGAGLVLAEAIAFGAVGAVLAVSDFAPEPYIQIFQLARIGKMDAALALQEAAAPTVKAVVSKYGVPGIKSALDIRGLHGGPPRKPLQKLSDGETDEVRSVLESLTQEGVLPFLAM